MYSLYPLSSALLVFIQSCFSVCNAKSFRNYTYIFLLCTFGKRKNSLLILEKKILLSFENHSFLEAMMQVL